jgi:hypothetical protein
LEKKEDVCKKKDWVKEKLYQIRAKCILPPSLPPPPLLARGVARGVAGSPYNKTSDVFSTEYKANTSRRIAFSADVIIDTSSNIRRI